MTELIDTTVVDDGALSDDGFLDGRLRLKQSRRGLRAGLDAIFVAAAVPVGPAVSGHAQKILDVGCGSGVVGLAVLARAGAGTLVGVELAPELVTLAQQNADLNANSDAAQFVRGDVRSGGAALEGMGLSANSFDHVVCNPPFFTVGTVRHAPDPLKDQANVMAGDDLLQWARFMTAAARADGTVTLVHAASALGDVLDVFRGRVGDLAIFPLFPHRGEAASRILVQGRKGARGPVRLLPGMVLHDADGGFRPEAVAVLRHAEPIDLSGQ